jgi:thiol-disulfide isomerase/thioredoxin
MNQMITMTVLFCFGSIFNTVLALDWSKNAVNKDGKGNLQLVWVHAQWCGPCKKMEKEGFATEESRLMMSQFSLLDHDEAEPLAREIMEHYRVQGFPTILILNAWGRELRRMVGYDNPKHLQNFLESSLLGGDELLELEQELAKSSGDVISDVSFRLMQVYLQRGHFTELMAMIRKCLGELAFVGQEGKLRNFRTTAHFMEKDYKNAIISAKAQLAQARTALDAREAISQMSRIHKKQKKELKLFALYQDTVRRFPLDPLLVRDFVREGMKGNEESKTVVLSQGWSTLRLAEPSEDRDRLQSVFADLLHESKLSQDAIRLMEELVAKYPKEEFYTKKLERFRAEAGA